MAPRLQQNIQVVLQTNLQMLCNCIYVDFRTDVRQAHTNLPVTMMPNDLRTNAICSTEFLLPTPIRIIIDTSGYDYMNSSSD